jgi:pimeloyl-ACP methyl ester carboxylesterase
VEAFASRHTTLAPDLRGFGTNASGPLVESVEQQARELVDLLDRHGHARAVVVGLSMGGYIAMALARRWPERVAGMLLADTRAEPDDDAGRAKRDAMIERVSKEGLRFVPDEMLPMLVSPSCAASIQLALRGWMLEQQPAGVIAAIRSLRNRPDARPALSALTCPVSLICGALDRLTPPAGMESMASAIQGATLQVVPGAGHLTNLEATGAFNAALRELLARVGADESRSQ